MTNKEKMLQMVLDDKHLQEKYGYKPEDYEDMQTALTSNSVVVAAVAKIIKELNGSTESSDYKKVYTMVFNYINNNI